MEVITDISSAIGQRLKKSFKTCARDTQRFTEAVNGFIDFDGILEAVDKVSKYDK